MDDDRPAVESAFEDGSALIPYITAGDPNLEATGHFVRSLIRGGADAIELGLPFSEPIAEGRTIQEAIFRSLAAGCTPDGFLEMVDSLEVDVPVLVMTYYNLIIQYGSHSGPESFVKNAAEVGISGLIVPDLPVEESGPLANACREYDVDLVFIVAPTTEADRVDRVMTETSGFAYVQARSGTTGTRSDISEQTFRSLSRLTEYQLPMAVGFGISTAEHSRQIIAGGADGIIVGSAFVEIISEGVSQNSPIEQVGDRLEDKARSLKQGVTEGKTSVTESN